MSKDVELFDKLWGRYIDIRHALIRRGIGNREGNADRAVWEMTDNIHTFEEEL